MTRRSRAQHSTHAVDAGQEGKIIRVRVSFTDDAGNEETLHSAATAAVGVSELHDRGHRGGGSHHPTWQDPNTHPSHGSYHILRHRPELGEDRALVYVEYTPSLPPSPTAR